MAYIGNTPAENYASFLTETFTVSATASYTLSHAVANENDIRLVINGVVQQPGSGKAYTASGTTLTLTSATVSGDVMYAVYLGRALQTVNPPNASVGTSQLADSSVTSAKLASGAVANTPAFEATLGSNQTISNNSYVKVLIDSEVYDSDGKFASNKFTPTIAGKYFVYGSAKLVTDMAQLQLGNCAIYKNGSIYAERQIDFRSNPAFGCNVDVSATIDMDEDDYVELYVKIYKTSGTEIYVNSANKTTNFGAYRIIE